MRSPGRFSTGMKGSFLLFHSNALWYHICTFQLLRQVVYEKRPFSALATQGGTNSDTSPPNEAIWRTTELER